MASSTATTMFVEDDEAIELDAATVEPCQVLTIGDSIQGVRIFGERAFYERLRDALVEAFPFEPADTRPGAAQAAFAERQSANRPKRLDAIKRAKAAHPSKHAREHVAKTEEPK